MGMQPRGAPNHNGGGGGMMTPVPNAYQNHPVAPMGGMHPPPQPHHQPPPPPHPHAHPPPLPSAASSSSGAGQPPPIHGELTAYGAAERAGKMRDYDTLCQIIQQWNNNRLDLFALSLPNEVRRD